jgi:CorA-like Mg2+ transporter protein
LLGTTSETQFYAEDISDQLQQVVAGLAAMEERCSALLVLDASLASKHLAAVSHRLAAVATIFLPISFLAGFFGQNFNILTGSIEKGWLAFLILGVGLSVAWVGDVAGYRLDSPGGAARQRQARLSWLPGHYWRQESGRGIDRHRRIAAATRR